MKIFFSYSHKDREIANRIYNGLRKYDLTLSRDVFGVKYTGSWFDFMDTVKEHDFLIVLISQNFMESLGCLYEALRFREVENFEKKVLPIAIDDHPYQKNSLDHYARFWNDEAIRLEALIQRNGSTPTMQKELDLTKEIRVGMQDIYFFLRGRKAIDAEQAIKSAYGDILRILFKEPDQLFEKFEMVIYDTLLSNEIEWLNAERSRIIRALDNPENLELLAKRRFKLGIRDAVRDKINEFVKSNKSDHHEVIQKLKELATWQEEQLVEAFVKTNDLREGQLIGHTLREKWKIPSQVDKQVLLKALEEPDFPYSKLEVVAELTNLANDKSMTPAIEKWLKEQVYKVRGREQTEAWALFCEILKRFDNELYQRLFSLAHYIFLKKRSSETEPFKFPLLINIHGFGPGPDNYAALLEGNEDEKLAAVWVLSFFGGIHIFLCDLNESPTILPQKSKNALLALSEGQLDYKDKWRLCCAAAEIHLLELAPWLQKQSKEKDMLGNTVSINHQTYGLIEEPEAAMAIRACGYFAYLSKKRGDTDRYNDLENFLSDWYANRKTNEARGIEVALTTAMGYLGKPRPLLFMLKKPFEEAWLSETVKNAVLRLTDRKEKNNCLKWIQEEIGKDEHAISENMDIPLKSKDIYIFLLKELESRLDF